MSELEFISTVKEYEILYINVNSTNEAKQLKIWEELAKMFNLKNGYAARNKWQILLEKYLLYLRCGGKVSYPYPKAMQFIQPYLINERQAGDSTSDLEIDENELQSILYSDEELETINYNVQTSTESSFATSNMDTKLIEMKKEERKFTDSTDSIKNEHKIYMIEPSNHRDARSTATTLNNLSSLELIFLGYARELQKMPLALQLQIKRKIADIMNEAEMQILNNKD